jgi:hypothetical protein
MLMVSVVGKQEIQPIAAEVKRKLEVVLKNV